MMLKGIDVSHHKSDLNLGSISYDFMITKATGGTGFVDNHCDTFVQQAIKAGKKWGVFHYYSDGFGGTNPVAEADYFVKNCAGYVGKGLLVLDWEKGGNPYWKDVSKAKAWLDRVYARTGVRPIIYMSADLVKTLNWSSVIKGGYGLWVAAWPKGNTTVTNYAMDSKTVPKVTWDGTVGPILWQFTSTGKLTGYGGLLDCDFFYGTRTTWDAYAAVHKPAVTPVPAPKPAPAPTPTPTPAPTPVPNPTSTQPVDTAKGLKTALLAIGAAVGAAIAWLVAWLHS